MMNKDDGGSAFPCESHFSDGTPNGFNPGMTLRDYFAAKALIGIMANNGPSWRDYDYQPKDGLNTIQNTAVFAYELADAMIAEGAK